MDAKDFVASLAAVLFAVAVCYAVIRFGAFVAGR